MPTTGAVERACVGVRAAASAMPYLTPWSGRVESGAVSPCTNWPIGLFCDQDHRSASSLSHFKGHSSKARAGQPVGTIATLLRLSRLRTARPMLLLLIVMDTTLGSNRLRRDGILDLGGE